MSADRTQERAPAAPQSQTSGEEKVMESHLRLKIHLRGSPCIYWAKQASNIAEKIRFPNYLGNKWAVF